MLILSIHNPSRSKRRSGEFCDLCIKCLGYGIIIIAHEKCNGQQFFKASPRSVVSCPYLSISLSAATGVLEFSFDILHDIFSLDLAMLFYFCSYVFSVACVNGWRWSFKVSTSVLLWNESVPYALMTKFIELIAWNNDDLIKKREHSTMWKSICIMRVKFSSLIEEINNLCRNLSFLSL